MKGMNNDITILKSTSEGPRKDQFIQFQLELEQYILKEFTSPDDIANIVKDLEDPSDNLNKQMTRIENIKNQIDSQGLDPDVDKEEIKLMKQSIKELYQQEMRLYAGRKQQLRSNKSKLFGTIWSQCTSTIQSELVNLKNYNEKRKNYDCLWLLENLKLLSSGIDSKQNSSYTAFEVASSIYHIRQQQNEGLDSYHKRFESTIKTAKLMGINYDLHDNIVESEKKAHPTENDDEINKRATNRYEAMTF